MRLSRLREGIGPGRHGLRSIAVEYPASKKRLSPPCVIHENPPHGLGGGGQEVRLSAPVDAPLIDELQESLVKQGRGLQRVALAFVSQAVCRQFAQFTI